MTDTILLSMAEPAKEKKKWEKNRFWNLFLDRVGHTKPSIVIANFFSAIYSSYTRGYSHTDRPTLIAVNVCCLRFIIFNEIQFISFSFARAYHTRLSVSDFEHICLAIREEWNRKKERERKKTKTNVSFHFIKFGTSLLRFFYFRIQTIWSHFPQFTFHQINYIQSRESDETNCSLVSLSVSLYVLYSPERKRIFALGT